METAADWILACIVAFFSWAFLVHWIPPLRLTPYAFLAGATTIILGFVFVIVSTSRGVHHNVQKPLPATTWLALTSPEAWATETASLKQRSIYHEIDVLPSSSLISLNIDALLDLTQRDFVKSWYSRISSGATFPNEVDRAVRIAVSRI